MNSKPITYGALGFVSGVALVILIGFISFSRLSGIIL